MRILFVEDCISYCDGVSLLLESLYPGISITKSNSGEDAITQLKVNHFDIAICDLQLHSDESNNLQGFHIAKFIKEEKPNIKILILTNIAGGATVLALRQLGVNGFLFKNVNKTVLKECIDTILNGQDYLQKEARNIIDKEIKSTSDPKIFISKEEYEVLQYLKLGFTAKAVSFEIKMPERTVRYNRDKLLIKTQTKNIAELVNFSMTNSLIVEMK